MILRDYRTALERLKGRRDQILDSREKIRGLLRGAEARVVNAETAQTVIQTVAQATQRELEYQVSELATLALSSVFPDPYQLRLVFELRRGRSEADLLFERGGNPTDPMSASGGGPVDVAAFALRVSLWSLRRPRSRAVMFLDEPFRFLSRNLQPLAGRMLKEVSSRLGLQIIMVTHIPELVEAADRVFTVAIRDGVSTVSEGPRGVDAHTPLKLTRAGEGVPGASGRGLQIENDPEVAAGGKESKRRMGNRTPRKTSPASTGARDTPGGRRTRSPDTPPAPAAASGHQTVSPPVFRRG